MDAKNSASHKHVTLLPDDIEKVSLFNLIKELFSPNISESNLLEHNITKDKENKYFHRKMIVLSLLIQILLKRFMDRPLRLLGTAIEDFLNGNLFLSTHILSFSTNIILYLIYDFIIMVL